MQNLRCVLVCLVVFLVTIKSTTASINKSDVEKCIAGTKLILLDQQNKTRTRLEEYKNRSLTDSQKYQDDKYATLNITILKERGILSTYKKSAINENYDVSSCNDSSIIYDLIQSAFNASAKEVAAEFRDSVSRNFTQTLFLVNQFASKYVQLEQHLSECGNTANCFEAIYEECTRVNIQNDMEQLETKFSRACEHFKNVLFTPKIDSLYKRKNKDVTDHTQKMRDCYKATKKSNGTEPNGNTGFHIQSMQFLILLPVLFFVLA